MISRRALLAQELYGVHPNTVRRWHREESFPLLKIGAVLPIPVEQADEWIADRVQVAS